MTKSFLTATAIAALLGFGATAAVAQQSAAPLNAPAIEKSSPLQSGKAASGTVQKQNKSSGTAAVKTSDTKAKRDAAAACGSIKDKTAHDACVKSHAKSQPTKTPAAVNEKAATPDKSKAAPRVGG